MQSIGVKKSNVVTCKDLADNFIKKVMDKAPNSKEIRIVFDTYPLVSLKKATRQSRNKKHECVNILN